MEDILGRTIKDGDMVIAKGTGRYNLGLRAGVFIDGTLRFKGGATASYSSYFLVETPSPRELKYKESIIADYEKMIEEREGRKSIKTIPPKDLIVGHEYETVSGDRFFYIGQCEYYKNLAYAKDNDIKEGNGFISSSFISDGIDLNNPSYFYVISKVDVIQGFKKFKKDTGRVMILPDSKSVRHSSGWSSYQLTIK